MATVLLVAYAIACESSTISHVQTQTNLKCNQLYFAVRMWSNMVKVHTLGQDFGNFWN